MTERSAAMGTWAALMVWGGLVPSGAQAQARNVALDEAIQLALRVQPAVVQAEGALDNSLASRRQAIGSWLPRLSLSSGLNNGSSTRFNSLTGENVTVASPFSYSAGINASLTVFDGLTRISHNRAASANVARDEAGLVNQRFQVTLLTKQAFFDAVAAAELERVGEARVRSAAEQLKIAKDKLAAGSAIRSDTLRSTVAYGQAQLALLNARAQRATAEASLARLIGVDGIVSAVVDPSIMTMSALDTAAIRAEALQNAPSIAQADAASRAASAQVNVSRSQYFPTVTASYSNSRTGTDLGALTPSWQAGLSLSWPLFNNFARETALSAALANRRSAEATAADARRQVNVLVTQHLASLAAAQAQVAIALASQDADDEDLRVRRERYRLGAATIVDVLTAQANLDQTQVDAVNARHAYQLARANLETLLGRKL